MLEPVFGSLVREQVLLFIYSHGEGYAREISRYFETPLDSVQKQLKRLERGSVLICERKGRTLIYRFNKKYPFLNELCELLYRVNYYSSSNTTRNRITQRRYSRKIRKGIERVHVIVKEYGDR